MPSAVHAPPVVMGGIVYAATCSSCGAAASRAVKSGKDGTTGFDVRNGRTRWRNSGGKYASPIIADQDRVYFTGRSRVYALEPKRGRGRGAGRSGRAERGKVERRAKVRRIRKRARRRHAAALHRKRQQREARQRRREAPRTTLPRWW